jgi:hypothetical protein
MTARGGGREKSGGTRQAQRPGIIVSGVDVKKAAQIRIERAQRKLIYYINI